MRPCDAIMSAMQATHSSGSAFTAVATVVGVGAGVGSGTVAGGTGSRGPGGEITGSVAARAIPAVPEYCMEVMTLNASLLQKMHLA